jgi:hypothetical protein
MFNAAASGGVSHCACNLTNVTKNVNKIPAIFFISQWFSSQDQIFPAPPIKMATPGVLYGCLKC